MENIKKKAYIYTRTYVHTHPTCLCTYLNTWTRRENKKKNMQTMENIIVYVHFFIVHNIVSFHYHVYRKCPLPSPQIYSTVNIYLFVHLN